MNLRPVQSIVETKKSLVIPFAFCNHVVSALDAVSPIRLLLDVLLRTNADQSCTWYLSMEVNLANQGLILEYQNTPNTV